MKFEIDTEKLPIHNAEFCFVVNGRHVWIRSWCRTAHANEAERAAENYQIYIFGTDIMNLNVRGFAKAFQIVADFFKRFGECENDSDALEALCAEFMALDQYEELQLEQDKDIARMREENLARWQKEDEERERKGSENQHVPEIQDQEGNRSD